MTVTGGLRARLIRDSLFHMIKDSLEALGWLDDNRYHSPIIFAYDPVDITEEIRPNTVGIDVLETRDFPLEVGSPLSEDIRRYEVDFFAESAALGEHFIYDVRDIIDGRLPSIGRDSRTLTVKDYRNAATPADLFIVHIDNVEVDKSFNSPQPWLKNWWACFFDVEDTYRGE